MFPIHDATMRQANTITENLFAVRGLKKIAAQAEEANLVRRGYNPGDDHLDLFLNAHRCGERNSSTLRNLWMKISSMHSDSKESSLQALSSKIEVAIQGWIRTQLNPERALDRYLERDLATQRIEKSLDTLLGNILSKEEIILAEDEEVSFDEAIKAPVRRRASFCYDFAFYKLNEERALPFISEMKSNLWPPELFSRTYETLRDWGYLELASLDDMKEGDLIVYFKRDGMEIQACHFGVVSSMKGRILSKWGETEAIFEHDYNKVPEAYGNFVSVFRKSDPKLGFVS